MEDKGIQVMFHFMAPCRSVDETHVKFREAFASMSTVPQEDADLEGTDVAAKQEVLLGNSAVSTSLLLRLLWKIRGH